jgi:hypothetical protein
MNKFISSITLALVTACPLVGLGEGSWEKDPAYLPIDKVLDLKTIRPEVNINLPRFLLQDAASELNGGTNDPMAGTGINFADLIKDVKLIRVVVIQANRTNRTALDKAVKTLRADLEAKWTPVVTVPEENVGVYAMGDAAGESMAGLAVLVYDGGDAVIGNVVGRVSLGKLIKIASRMDKLPKGLLEKLGGLGNTAGARPPSSNVDSEAKRPVEAPEGAAKKPDAK